MSDSRFEESPGGGLIAAGTLVATPNGTKTVDELLRGESVLSAVGDGMSRFYAVNEVRAIHYRGPMLHFTVKAAKENDFKEFSFRVTPSHICLATLNHEQWKTTDPSFEASVGIYGFERFDLIANLVRHTVDGQEQFQDVDQAVSRARKIAASRGGAKISLTFQHVDENFDDAYYLFQPAAELKVGMLVITAREFVINHAFITEVVTEDYDGLAYALDIPVVRNFAANGVVVHDSTLPSDQAQA